MTAITKLHDIYQRRGYEIRSNLHPGHFRCISYRNLPLSVLYFNGRRISAGGGIAFTEMLFFEMLCRELQPKNILIIGNAFGLSTVLLALLNPSARVVAIDAGIEGADNDAGNALTERIAAEETLNIRIVRWFSPDAVPGAVHEHLNDTVDMVFIDGLHTNAQQTADFEAAWKHGGSKCTYVFHDVLNYQLQPSFSAIAERHAEQHSDILWRTPSGMGVLLGRDAGQGARRVVDLWTQTPRMIAAARQDVRLERLVMRLVYAGWDRLGHIWGWAKQWLRRAAALSLLLAIHALAEPVPLAWELPTELASGEPIPAELVPDISVTVYAARQGETNWQAVAVFQGATNGVVDLPVGAWLIRATAAFPGGEESEPSDVTGGKVYGKLRKVGKLWVVKVTQ